MPFGRPDVLGTTPLLGRVGVRTCGTLCTCGGIIFRGLGIDWLGCLDDGMLWNICEETDWKGCPPVPLSPGRLC